MYPTTFQGAQRIDLVKFLTGIPFQAQAYVYIYILHIIYVVPQVHGLFEIRLHLLERSSECRHQGMFPKSTMIPWSPWWTFTGLIGIGHRFGWHLTHYFDLLGRRYSLIWMSAWVNKWVSEWMNEWMNQSINQSINHSMNQPAVYNVLHLGAWIPFSFDHCFKMEAFLVSVCSHLASVRSTSNRLHSASLVLPVPQILRKSRKNYFCTLPANTVWYVLLLTKYRSDDYQNLAQVSWCFGQHFITVFVWDCFCKLMLSWSNLS